MIEGQEAAKELVEVLTRIHSETEAFTAKINNAVATRHLSCFLDLTQQHIPKITGGNRPLLHEEQMECFR